MKYLITGGTGSFSRHFIDYLLENTKDTITVFSRDEFKQWKMKSDLNTTRVSYIVGDVRDREAVMRATEGVDRVVHTAALKHVATGEAQPNETIKTNIGGTENVVDAANRAGAVMVLLSTDKAVHPVNLYGATKMAAEYITLTGGQRVVRYGNVFGSRGSVLHIFKERYERDGVFPITSLEMTRFIITFDEAVWQVLKALQSPPKTVTVPDLKAIRIVDLARAFDENAKIIEYGVQPGEKLHEVLSLSPYRCSDTAEKYTIEEIRGLIDANV